MKNNVRENFRKIRTKLGITQEQMAQFLNLEQSSISKFESGERDMSIDNIEKASNLFGILIHSLYENIDDVSLLSPSFRKSGDNVNSFSDIAEINKIAMNILEMNEILGNNNE